MPTKKPSRAVKTTAKKADAKTKNSVKTKQPKAEPTASEKRFIRDAIIRGEAVVVDSEGKLPPGATHVIVENEEGETPQIERERFSLY
ncbi:MAG: hypothetical protein M3033_17735 [Acidobacteriota bacterium]|nr:hypothetical protein [Acidobacteriota bacterium]